MRMLLFALGMGEKYELVCNQKVKLKEKIAIHGSLQSDILKNAIDALKFEATEMVNRARIKKKSSSFKNVHIFIPGEA